MDQPKSGMAAEFFLLDPKQKLDYFEDHIDDDHDKEWDSMFTKLCTNINYIS